MALLLVGAGGCGRAGGAAGVAETTGAEGADTTGREGTAAVGGADACGATTAGGGGGTRGGTITGGAEAATTGLSLTGAAGVTTGRGVKDGAAAGGGVATGAAANFCWQTCKYIWDRLSNSASCGNFWCKCSNNSLASSNCRRLKAFTACSNARIAAGVAGLRTSGLVQAVAVAAAKSAVAMV